MTNTLATRKQSEAIRDRMRQIRSDLPYDVDDVRQQVRQLTDWRYQFRKRPATIMTAAAVAGYLLVPQARKEREIIVRTSGGERVQQPKPATKGLIGGLVAAAATMSLNMAMKSGTSMLTQHLSSSLLKRANHGGASVQERSGYPGSGYANTGNTISNEVTA
ncbi:hypothetical protein LF1_38810 [Rubripirellula obstinata]|uniref:DUF3618 domain-containing protein n=1 Tax=Rubripirellula obstinata TaxID=406547 RepID=A0A5B1CQ38_9BACT|nr:hypothetical protein [Rubripirellula obstinata]KAA1261334.1 hypothetical protein LF1_38810 [Rubripirellula obstinata]